MVTYTESQLGGHACLRLENEALALWVTRDLGPRILGLALAGGDNLLALLPETTLPCPGRGPYHLRGGHRLWYAPEDPPRTYWPDDEPVSIQEQDQGLLVTQPPEPLTGIQKSLRITLPGPEARVVIEHRLENRGSAPIELAPWAITQLRPGGVALLPQPCGPIDEYGVLPNRHLVLWPYTAVHSPHLRWDDRFVWVEARLSSGALKVGFPNPAGWLGYVVGETLFVKQAAYDPAAAYPDRGSSSECYAGPLFLELETLGPWARLAPGQSVAHHETWTAYAGVSCPADEAAAEALAARLGLGAPGR
jgi:hypothetical protein